MATMSILHTHNASVRIERFSRPCTLHHPERRALPMPRVRVRRIVFLVLMVALVSASSTGLSRSACGQGVEGLDGFWSGGGTFDEEFDASSGCVDGNARCFGFH